MNFKINLNQRRMGASLIASIAMHILLVVFIGMENEEKPLPKKETPQVMDVVLLDDEKKEKPEKAPEDARTMSNRSAVGGSSKAEDRVTRQARAPMPAPQQQRPRPEPPKQPKTPPVPSQQQRNQMLARRGTLPDSSKTNKREKQSEEKPKVTKEQPQVPMASLMPSTMAMSQLSRDFQREKRMKQQLSREADIPINTKQAKYAPYAQALVRALEDQWRPGQANYAEFAEDARRSLIKITIESNGDLAGIEILRPSPIPQINNSAVEAIHAAAPFKVLPSSWGLDRVSFYLTFEVVEDRFVFRPM